MQLPLQVTFRNLGHSDAIETKIRERAEKLQRYCDEIIGCRVIIDAQHKHHRHGNHYHVRVDITVPDSELVANREPDENHAYTDVYVAIRDAFDSIRRQLEDYGQRRSRQVKTHATAPQG